MINTRCKPSKHTIESSISVLNNSPIDLSADAYSSIRSFHTPPPTITEPTLFNKSFFIGHTSSDFLKNRLRKLTRLIQRLPSETRISSIDRDELFSILEESTQISMSIRSELIGYKDSFYPSHRKALVEHDDIKAYVGEDFILKLSLPPLIGRRFKGSYDIYWRVKLILEELATHYQFPSFSNEKLILIYKKYSPQLNGRASCDNDNWEASRVTNAITEALQYSDNSEHFSMFFTAVESDFSGTEALVIPFSKLDIFLPYLSETTPYHDQISTKKEVE